MIRFTSARLCKASVVMALLSAIAFGCSSNSGQSSVTSIQGARLYGLGGVNSAGFGNGLFAFQGPFSAATSSIANLSPPADIQFFSSLAVDPTDSTGGIYVSTEPGFESGSPQVLKYARPGSGNNNPLFAVSGLKSPGGITFDTNGNLYVIDGPTVFVVKHPVSSSSVPVALPNVSTGALALDNSGNLYVLASRPNGTPVLYMYAPPYNSAPISTTNLVTGPVAITYDQAAGLLYATSIPSAGNSTISAYTLPLTSNESPRGQVNVHGVGALAFDAAGDSFFSSAGYSTGSVAVATPPFNGQTSFTFATSPGLSALTLGP